MAEAGGRTVTPTMLAELAALAQLDLADERRTALAEQLDGLLSAANAVNRFMEDRREVGPAVRFGHPDGAQPR